jgi:hypothetical protein
VAKPFKTISIGVAVLALGVMLDASAPVNAADALSQEATPPKHQMRKATDPGARRHDRRYARVVARGDEGYYYDRPVYYRPYPYPVPAPFFLGFAFAPPW